RGVQPVERTNDLGRSPGIGERVELHVPGLPGTDVFINDLDKTVDAGDLRFHSTHAHRIRGTVRRIHLHKAHRIARRRTFVHTDGRRCGAAAESAGIRDHVHYVSAGANHLPRIAVDVSRAHGDNRAPAL